MGGMLFSKCHHVTDTSPWFALGYCFILAVAYVGSLYVFVPAKVRKLHRDDPKQIKWRILVTLGLSVTAIGTHPFLFCRGGAATSNIDEEAAETFSIVDVMIQPQGIMGVLVHTMILYMGPIAGGLLRVYEKRKHSRRQARPASYARDVVGSLLYPSFAAAINPVTEQERWTGYRNFVMAPLTEEIIFRGCMIPALLSCGMNPIQVSLVAPLFFGVAHVHHAITRISAGEKWVPVLIMSLFQFAYTSLFGSYVAYAFVRSGSVLAVTASHAYCNWMGLPDLSFMQAHHPMHQNYRMPLLICYVVGSFTFQWFLKKDFLLPLPPRLLDSMNLLD